MSRRFLFVFDTTGSMSAWISEVTTQVGVLSTEVLNEDVGSEVGFIAYGDHCDGPNMIQDSTLENGEVPVFTRKSGDIERWLAKGHSTSGGDLPEAVECVLKYIADVHLAQLHDDTQLIVFWVGDAAPHEPNECERHVDWREQLQRLVVAGVPIYTALCGGDRAAKMAWDTMASATGGVSVDLWNIRNLLTTMIAVVKKETGRLDAYAKAVRDRGADSEMEEILVDLGATCLDR